MHADSWPSVVPFLHLLCLYTQGQSGEEKSQWGTPRPRVAHALDAARSRRRLYQSQASTSSYLSHTHTTGPQQSRTPERSDPLSPSPEISSAGCSPTRRHGHRRRRLRVLHAAPNPPPPQEAQAVPDGGDEGADRLRRLRAQGAEGAGGHGGRELRGRGGAAAQGDGDGVRGRRQGHAPRRLQDGQARRAVALRALRRGGAPLRPRGIRQEGAARVRPQRRRRPHRRAARKGVVHRGQVRQRLQRREPQRLRRHVI